MTSMKLLLLLSSLLISPIAISAQGLDSTKIDQKLGRSGQKIGDVYKVGFPRTDLRVSVHGLAIKAGFALGSWAAFTGTDENAMVMGDLVLLEDELNPVMEKLRSAGFEISAVHNHLIGETPRVVYLHYMGHGDAPRLATSLRDALALSKTPLEKPAAPTEEPTPPAWVKSVEQSVGKKGTWKGGVLAFGVPRAKTITLSTAKDPLGIMDGTVVPPAAGVAEAINFQAADAGNVATTGDFVLIAEEVNAVITELQSHHILVTALHSHMLTEQPRLFFMHFWAVGDPEAIGAGIAAALKHVSTQ
jgi:hypothetical protein